MNAIRRALLLSSTLGVLASCTAAPSPQTRARPDANAELSEKPVEPIDRALQAAFDRGSWRDLRVESECQDDAAHLRAIVLFGSGVGIWERERQFAVSTDELWRLLRELSRGGLGSLHESYGGGDDPDDGPGEEPSEAFGLRLICRIRLVLDGVEKESYQLSEGHRSPELRTMAEKVLSVGATRGPAGIGAESLSDGLLQLARGELASEALTLQLQRQPDDPKSPEEGWILRLEYGEAHLSRSSPSGWSDPEVIPLSPADFSDLARRLAAAHPDDLPGNLYSTWYQDLEIRVLNRRATLQARRFTGLTRETHGEKQKRFDAMIEALEAVKNRADRAR